MNLPSSNTPHQEAEKRWCITTNAPRNPYVSNSTNAPLNPYAFVAPAATATFATATSLRGSVYYLFGIDTYERSDDGALPTFPPCEDDDYKDDNNADKDANHALSNREQLPRAPSANAYVNTLHSIFYYDTGN